MSLSLTLAVLGWGTAVGLDLVSVPQAMIARPLVAGPVAGLLVGDPATGILLGLLFELFQYDILPVGAARYPEYGPATVAAVAAAADHVTAQGLALGAVVGLVTALAGGASLNLLRRINTRVIHAAAPRLERGDPKLLGRLHAGGILRDGLRAALVTTLGLALGPLARVALTGTLVSGAAALVGAAAVGAGLAAGAAGTVRLVGRGPELRWLVAGVALGVLGVWLL